MTWSDYYDAPTGQTLYAKPKPLQTATWSSDVVTMTESGSTGEYAISGLTDGVDYTVFVQSGGSPASSDTKDGSIYYRIPLSEITSIQSSVSTIGTGLATVNAPVADDGGLSYLVIGDDYLASNGRALEWTFDEISGITTSGAASFGLQNADDVTEEVTLSGSILDLGSGTFKAQVEIQDTDLSALSAGYYNWSVSVIESGTKITIAQNLQRKTRVQLLEKYSS